MNQEVVQNSVLALQDHCSYIAPTTKPPYQTIRHTLQLCITVLKPYAELSALFSVIFSE